MSVRQYVHLSVHKKSFFNYSEIWHVDRGQWVMHDCMQYDQIQGQSHKPWMLENLPFLKAIFSAIYNGSWPLILKLGHNI